MVMILICLSLFQLHSKAEQKEINTVATLAHYPYYVEDPIVTVKKSASLALNEKEIKQFEQALWGNETIQLQQEQYHHDAHQQQYTIEQEDAEITYATYRNKRTLTFVISVQGYYDHIQSYMEEVDQKLHAWNVDADWHSMVQGEVTDHHDNHTSQAWLKQELHTNILDTYEDEHSEIISFTSEYIAAGMIMDYPLQLQMIMHKDTESNKNIVTLVTPVMSSEI